MMFWVALILGISYFVSQILDGIILIALHWLGKYNFYSAHDFVTEKLPKLENE